MMNISNISIGDLIINEVTQKAYHPRSSEYSDNQSRVILRDLLAACPLMASRAASGELVAKLKHHQQVRNNDWVIDIALGTPRGAPQPPPPGKLITETEPTLIQVAIELKSIWTEHGKARMNRLRDLKAFHSHAHDYDRRVVAGGFLVINASEYFLSPLNLGKSNRGAITRHGSKTRPASLIVKETIDKFRDIHLRQYEGDGPGLEAIGVIVVEHDNINYLSTNSAHPDESEKYNYMHKPGRVVESAPALKPGDPLHYDAMLQRICVQYTNRFR